MRRGGSAGVGVGGGGVRLIPSHSVVIRGPPSQNELLSRVTFFHQISRCFLGACFLKPRITFFANNVKKWPQKGPKRTTQTIKFTDVRPLKTYGIYSTDHTFCSFGCALGSIFFTPFFGHCFFITFSLFEKLGARIVPKMDEYSMQKIWQIQPCHQKAPMRPQGEPRAFQMTPKCSPKVLKWCPRDP